MTTLRCVTGFVIWAVGVSIANAQVKVIEPNESGSASAVVVKGRALVHTSQVFGAIEAKSPKRQVVGVFRRLDAVLKKQRSSLQQVVKLNVYVTRQDVIEQVRKQLVSVYSGARKPAVAYVVTALPVNGALIALDAVATRKPTGGDVVPGRGRLVYISGQAIRAGDLAESTRKTMAGLHRTLKHLRLDASHVVQVKTFFKPMKDVAVVNREIAKFYPKGKHPAVSHVEWTSRLIEIELIAFAPYKKGEKPSRTLVRFVTPPWMKSSPVFSRVAVVESDTLIYVSGLYGPAKADGAKQVRDIFGQLNRIVKKAGGDLRHLAKATYYVSSSEASKQLNLLRPKFYDPERPPAASKAAVAGVGMPGRGVVVDMIAVPRKGD